MTAIFGKIINLQQFSVIFKHSNHIVNKLQLLTVIVQENFYIVCSYIQVAMRTVNVFHVCSQSGLPRQKFPNLEEI